MFDLVWRLLLESYCVLCREPVKGPDRQRQLCRWCLASLPWRPEPEQAPPTGISRVFAPLYYDGAARQWVLEAKQAAGLIQARTLGVLLAAALLDAYPFPAERPDLLVPVPLSRRRLAGRGHNQAVLIAAQVAKAMDIRLHRRAARRTRHTGILAGLDARQRQEQVAGGFAAAPLPTGCRVAIIDDVVTSGATAGALAEALRAAGAAEVMLWAASAAAHPD